PLYAEWRENLLAGKPAQKYRHILYTIYSGQVKLFAFLNGYLGFVRIKRPQPISVFVVIGVLFDFMFISVFINDIR
ncbi:MAG TPA: hypothetical protein DCQ76_01425, partial [Ruminococcaceae bacterium]|nr:hypothetical protein [Oscillospiraceae bacterium]